MANACSLPRGDSAKSGFILLNLLVYCLVLGFMLIFFGRAIELVVKSGNTLRALDVKVELFSALSIIERDIKKTGIKVISNRVSHNNIHDKNHKPTIVFSFNQNDKLIFCGWEVKDSKLRRIDGLYSVQKERWINRRKINVMAQNIKSFNAMEIRMKKNVVGISLEIITNFGYKISRVIALNQ